MYYSAVCYRQEGVDVRSCILSLVDLFSHWLSQPLHTHTSTANKSCFVATFVFAVEVHVTRARSLPKIKARFHILMLVSCLCDQNDQLSFLVVEVHVTRARSLPKIKARFHILMLVSCLCDQNDQLSFLGVEVHVTRASSLPKIKARFHIFMLVSWLCDQNDQLWFLGSKFTRCNSTHIAISAMTWFEKVGGCSTQSTPDCGSPDSE